MAASHNFFHMRDNFRMYYFDLGVISSKNWRVSHVLSHHLYSNTAWDWEIYGLEPFLCYLPADDKSIIYRFVTVLLSPIVLCVAIFIQAAQRWVLSEIKYTLFGLKLCNYALASHADPKSILDRYKFKSPF